MNQTHVDTIKHDFRVWSGGFSPESGDQIAVYLDYAAPRMTDKQRRDMKDMLWRWMETNDPDADLTPEEHLAYLVYPAKRCVTYEAA